MINTMSGIHWTRWAASTKRPRDIVERSRSIRSRRLHICISAFLQAYAWNRFAEAVPLIERAIDLDPGNPSIAGVLAFVLLDMDEETRSARQWPTRCGIAPDECMLTRTSYAAWYYSTLGDHARGAKACAKGPSELDPRDSGPCLSCETPIFARATTRTARARYASAFPELF